MAGKNLKITGPDVQKFTSGETRRIKAKVGNYPKSQADRFKWMLYECMENPKLVDRHSGLFSAPQVSTNTTYTVKVSVEAELSVSRIFSILVRAVATIQLTPTAQAATVTQQQQPVSPRGNVSEIVLLKDRLTVESGASVGIMAMIINLVGKGKKFLNYVVEGIHGEVDPKSGRYTAPIVEQDATERVKAFCVNDTSIAPRFATIIIKKAVTPKIYIYKKIFGAKSGIDRTVKLDPEIRGWIGRKPKPKFIFIIENGDGEIDDRGVFQVPLVYGNKQTVIKIIASEGLTDNIEVIPETVTINIEKTPLPTIHPLKDKHAIESGGKVKILDWVELRNWNEKRPKPRLSIGLKKGDGEIDYNGVYHSEVTDENDEVEVTIFTPEELTDGFTIVPIDIKIMITGKEIAEIKPSSDLKFGAKCEIKFKAKSDFTIHPRWQIINPAPEKGYINPETGIYKTPDIIKTEQDIGITLTDINTGKKAKPVTVKLMPVSLIDKDAETGNIRTLNAGGKPIEMNVLSYYDLEGMRNYTCRIVKPFSAAGRIIEERFYEPPIDVDGLTELEIEVVSKSDKSKKIRHKLMIDFPKCKECSGPTDQDGVCTLCGEAVSYGAYLAKLKRTGGKL